MKLFIVIFLFAAFPSILCRGGSGENPIINYKCVLESLSNFLKCVANQSARNQFKGSEDIDIIRRSSETQLQTNVIECAKQLIIYLVPCIRSHSENNNMPTDFMDKSFTKKREPKVDKKRQRQKQSPYDILADY